ncbi:hypothetical protein HYW54_02555 [Candidatus Gottesmanbacteria bacterium]|nr:hypothetical protein [Candidatus Gottesmanbacteria bacterium]
MLELIAQTCKDSPLGCLEAPSGVVKLPTITIEGGGRGIGLGPIILLVNLGFKILFIGAGLYAFFNLITAGYQFIGAGGDAKAVTAAWSKIQQTFIGIIVIVVSFLIAAIFGQILFGDALYFLQPSLTIKTS